MNSGTWFQCHICSSLWGTPENLFQMQLSPASHGTETTSGWRRVACTMASNVGILHTSVGYCFGQAGMRCPETSCLLFWDTDPPRSIHETPVSHASTASPQISSLSSCSYTPQLSTFPQAETFSLSTLLESHVWKKPHWMGLSGAMLRDGNRTPSH